MTHIPSVATDVIRLLVDEPEVAMALCVCATLAHATAALLIDGPRLR